MKLSGKILKAHPHNGIRVSEPEDIYSFYDFNDF